MVAQWVWNIRLELGHQLHPDPVRTVSRLLLPSRLSRNRLPTRLLSRLAMLHPLRLLASESWPFHRLRLSSPARWNAPVSGRAVASSPGAASGN